MHPECRPEVLGMQYPGLAGGCWQRTSINRLYQNAEHLEARIEQAMHPFQLGNGPSDTRKYICDTPYGEHGSKNRETLAGRLLAACWPHALGKLSERWGSSACAPWIRDARLQELGLTALV
ncbi:hypothetical protein X797_004348 [Metarhizium robertsii]|uniref:Uncharacterized protein n=1 Tax=Metarhizium robertsii TaxID=568076 RepID=A0A0A1UWC7_9HYPO|nr:hypothetical protein X797_004348 [Metarhizium robertsii]